EANSETTGAVVEGVTSTKRYFLDASLLCRGVCRVPIARRRHLAPHVAEGFVVCDLSSHIRRLVRDHLQFCRRAATTPHSRSSNVGGDRLGSRLRLRCSGPCRHCDVDDRWSRSYSSNG